MHKVAALFAMTVLLAPVSSAQTKKDSGCRIHFAVAPGYAPNALGAWPPDGKKWWQDEGKRKFPELCEAVDEKPEFVITWGTEASIERKGSVGVTTQEAPRAESNCTPGGLACSGFPDTPQQKTSRQREKDREFERAADPKSEVGKGAYTNVYHLFVTVYRIEPDKSVPVKSIAKAGASAGKDSFQSSMSLIQKESKSRTR